MSTSLTRPRIVACIEPWGSRFARAHLVTSDSIALARVSFESNLRGVLTNDVVRAVVGLAEVKTSEKLAAKTQPTASESEYKRESLLLD